MAVSSWILKLYSEVFSLMYFCVVWSACCMKHVLFSYRIFVRYSSMILPHTWTFSMTTVRMTMRRSFIGFKMSNSNFNILSTQIAQLYTLT